MTPQELLPFIDRIKGCTFASIDTETKTNGIRHIHINERIILFNSETSGYERMVHRRLLSLGKDPSMFVVGDLPWGTRVRGPLIENKGKHYLQSIRLEPGTESYFLGSKAIAKETLGMFGIKPRYNGQGLPDDKAVHVSAYNLEHIQSLRLLRETIGIKA